MSCVVCLALQNKVLRPQRLKCAALLPAMNQQDRAAIVLAAFLFFPAAEQGAAQRPEGL